ncbi:MAG TPA: hypothetical protein VFY04_03035 [Solirubrobacterales bacterium]|nr:hypothetical protein [Solirubrobacterales bacterium]
MTEAKALITTFAAALTLLVAVIVGLDLIGANDELLVVAYILIAAGGSFAVSEVVAHYAKRDKSARRQPHNPPPSG